MSARDRLMKRRSKKIAIDGGDMFVRAMTIREAMEADKIPNNGEASQIKRLAFLVATCLTDEDGTPVFTGPDDETILDVPSDTLRELTAEIIKLSGAGNNAKKLEKNSDATP